MSHVKVINKKSGVPQLLTLKTYNNIQSKMPKLAANLEFLYECDEDGKKLEEVKTYQELEAEAIAKQKAEHDAKLAAAKKTTTKTKANGKKVKKEESVQSEEKKPEIGPEHKDSSGESKDIAS